MTLLEIVEGDTVFFRMGGKVYSGKVFVVGHDYVQVRTPAGALISRRWYSICFYTRGPRVGQAFASGDAELVLPSSFSEIAQFQAEADTNNRSAER